MQQGQGRPGDTGTLTMSDSFILMVILLTASVALLNIFSIPAPLRAWVPIALGSYRETEKFVLPGDKGRCESSVDNTSVLVCFHEVCSYSKAFWHSIRQMIRFAPSHSPRRCRDHTGHTGRQTVSTSVSFGHRAPVPPLPPDSRLHSHHGFQNKHNPCSKCVPPLWCQQAWPQLIISTRCLDMHQEHLTKL